MRRDFWEPSEGRGSHSSLKREEDRKVEIKSTPKKRHTCTRQQRTKRGTGLDMLKKKTLTGYSC